QALQRVKNIWLRELIAALQLFLLSSSGSQRLAENNLPPSTCKHVSSEEHFPFGVIRSPSLFYFGRFVLFSFQRTFPSFCDLFMLTHSLIRCQYYFRYHLATLNNLP
ncbi:hypothetical protein DXK91_01380, partial [Parageobacillus toebii]